jgi:hypothetical protein
LNMLYIQIWFILNMVIMMYRCLDYHAKVTHVYLKCGMGERFLLLFHNKYYP